MSLTFKAFTPEEDQTWRLLFDRQSPKRHAQLFSIFEEGLELLRITGSGIPPLDKVNRRLEKLTGFNGIPVVGLEEEAGFFKLLSDRKFPIGNFIREPKDLSYTPAPDVFHDLYGHIPFFANKDYADFCWDFGARAIRYHDRPKILEQFKRLFWFTVEFGLIETSEGRRIFGAGIASSFTECAYALSDKPKVIPFDLDVIRHQEFRIDLLQETLFLLPDTKTLYQCLEEFERRVH